MPGSSQLVGSSRVGSSQLVALALPGGPRFVEEMSRAWDRGDAVLPVDPRLPPRVAEALLSAMRPSVVVGPGREKRHLPGGVPVEDDDAVVVATSGSTGEPRGVVLTRRALAASARASATRLGVDPARDHWLACLPLAHVGGLSVVTRALVTGTALSVHPGFHPASVERAVREQGATCVSLVPAALGRVDTSGFRVVLVGGSEAPGKVASNVVVTYGMTETGGGVAYDGELLEGVEARVVDGEIQLRGPMLLRCYRDGTDPRTAGGWLPTGDAGALIEGRIVVRGRLSDLMITGGENVWPAPVEAVLARHPSVAEVAVAGQADPEWGEAVTAFIVPADVSDPPTLDQLRDWARGDLPGYALPRRLVLVEALERTAIGKVARHRLRSL